MARKWTKQTAEEYTKKVEKRKEQKGLTYWSAIDYLKHHRDIGAIV